MGEGVKGSEREKSCAEGSTTVQSTSGDQGIHPTAIAMQISLANFLRMGFAK